MSNSWVCVDASLLVRLFMEAGDLALQAQWQTWQESAQPLAAPALLHSEATNAIHQYQRRGFISAETSRVQRGGG